MGEAPKGKQAFRKAYNREIKRQADEEIFGAKPLSGEVIPPKRRNQWNKIELTAELKEEIVQRVASGELMKHICQDEHIPSYFTVHREEERDAEFGADMRAARRVSASIYADEVIEISDEAKEDVKPDGSVNYELIARSKLRADNRKWIAGKLDPARFSDRVQTDITSGGEKLEAKEITPLESARQIAFILELSKHSQPEGKED